MLFSSLTRGARRNLALHAPADDNGGSSTATENNADPNAAASAAGGKSDANTSAASSEAGAGEKKETLLSVVQNAAKEPVAGESPTPGEAGKAAVETAPKVETPTGELTEEQKLQQAEDSKRLDKHPRFQEVIRERDTFKQGHEEYQKIEDFTRANKLSPQDVANGYVIMAALKNDPMKAITMLEPIWNALQQFNGAVLPDDLKTEVEKGELSQERAQEIAKSRNLQTFQGKQTEDQKQDALRQQQEREAVEANRAVGEAITEWEGQTKKIDPDYAKKEDLMRRFTLAKIHELGDKAPANAADIIELLKGVYDEVNKHLGGFTPARQSTSAAATSHASTTTAVKTPTTMLELVQQVGAIPA